MGTNTGTYDQLVHFGANQMIPGEEIRIDSLGNERFWYVSRPTQGLIQYIDETGEPFHVHRAFAMTLAQYKTSCDLRAKAIWYPSLNTNNFEVGTTL